MAAIHTNVTFVFQTVEGAKKGKMRVNTWDVAHHFLKRFLCSPLPVVRRAGRAALAENRVWVREEHDGGHFLDRVF